MKRKIFVLNIIIIFVISFSKVYATTSIPVWSSISNEVNNTNTITSSSKDIKNTTSKTSLNIIDDDSLNPNAIAQTSGKIVPVENNPLNLTCGGAVLIEQNSGTVLYNHNMHQKLRPASVTKVMTILLIMEALDSGKISLNDKVPCSDEASSMGGSQIWLDTTEELTVDEMLKAICVVSANDCTVAMAEYLEGSQDAFVNKMNEKAKELGMNDTTFKNCHGIDEDGHETCPYDIALMSRELLTKHPAIMNYTTIYMDSLRDGKSQLVNTNKLIKNYDGCTGLKTGSTSIALFNLSASATRNDLSLIAVIMKAETSQVRFAEARKLLDYGFSNYQYKSLANSGETVGVANVGKGLKSTTDAVFKDDFGLILPKSNSQNIEQQVEIYNNISAPITQGQKVGEVTFSNNGETIGTVDLIANENIEKYGILTMSKKIYTNWFTMLRN